MSVDALLRMSERRPGPPEPSFDGTALQALFHQLNNQLGVALAHAELLEAKAPDVASRSRAAEVVAATLEAMRLAQAIRAQTDPS